MSGQSVPVRSRCSGADSDQAFHTKISAELTVTFFTKFPFSFPGCSESSDPHSNILSCSITILATLSQVKLSVVSLFPESLCQEEVRCFRSGLTCRAGRAPHHPMSTWHTSSWIPRKVSPHLGWLTVVIVQVPYFLLRVRK